MSEKFTSKSLIALLSFLNPEIGDNSLAFLLMVKNHTFTRLKYGLYSKKDPREGYWPNETTWAEKARGLVEELDSRKERSEYLAPAGLEQYDSCIPSYAEDVVSLEDHTRQILLRFAEDYQERRGLDRRGIRDVIAEHLMSGQIDADVIDRVRQLQTLPEICAFLTKTARQKGKTALRHESIHFFSFPGLQKTTGISAEEAARQLLKISGISEEQGDYVDLWAAHMSRFGYNWGFVLNEKDRIVGGFAMALLTQEQERLYRDGSLPDSKITAESAASADDEEIAIDLLCLRALPEYAFSEALLWERFADRLLELARNGICFRSIYTTLTAETQKTLFLKRGFRNLCLRDGGGDVFHLDLMYDVPRAFSGVFPGLYEEYASKFDARKITYAPCPDKEKLTSDQARQLAGLLYSSDRYILSSIFYSYSQAKTLLGNLIKYGNDTVFCPKNLFCAFCGDRIIGAILFAPAPLTWSVDTLRQEAFYLDTQLKPTDKLVEEVYFPSYQDVSGSTLILLDDSVDPLWNSPDRAIAIGMLKAFIAQYGKKYDMQTHILRETTDEIAVFRSVGFSSDGKIYDGFSPDEKKPPCFHMLRPKSKP